MIHGNIVKQFGEKSWVQATKGVCDDHTNKDNDDSDSTVKMTSNMVSLINLIPAMIFISVFMILPFF